MEQVRALAPMDDPLSKLPFVHETLSTLRSELRGTPATLLGFIGCSGREGAEGQRGRDRGLQSVTACCQHLAGRCATR